MKFSHEDPILAATESIGAAALEAIRQRDAARAEAAELRELAATCGAVAAECLMEMRLMQERHDERIRELEAQGVDIEGRVFDIDLRDAIHALLKSEMTAGDLRRALRELVR